MSIKEELGQFFTINVKICDLMSSLLFNPLGKVLEPSAGAGNLMLPILDREYESLTGFELDHSIKPLNDMLHITYGDFFKLSEYKENFYNSIIGNPPYVTWKNVNEATKEYVGKTFHKYNEKANLYHLFIDRCIDLLAPDGQLVFITPKEWLYLTSAQPLREKIEKEGKITHFVDVGEAKIFPDANVPGLSIFRFQKSKKIQSTMFLQWGKDNWVERDLKLVQGLYVFQDLTYSHTISDFFDVKVGLVTGADNVFNVTNHPKITQLEKEGNIINMLTTKGVVKSFYSSTKESFEDFGEVTQRFLKDSKSLLLNRRIKKFGDSNYWLYGAYRNVELMCSNKQRIYCFYKTRREEVFFLSDCKFFNGGLYCLYVKDNVCLDLEKVVEYLNSNDFKRSCDSMGLVSGGKISFQPSTLARVPVPDLALL